MINARGGQPPSEGTVGSKKRASLWLAIGRRTAVSYGSIRRAAPLAALRPEVTRCLRNAGCLEDCSCTAGPAVDRGARRTRGALPRNEPLAGCARRACRETFVDPKHPSRLPIARHATGPTPTGLCRRRVAGRPRTPFKRVALGAVVAVGVLRWLWGCCGGLGMAPQDR